ncbi:MAG: T9SS type A sorting domain-containing protein, partial [Crocinitomicaceae bacterium]
LNLHDSLSLVSATILPDSIVGNLVYWSYDSLSYFEQGQIGVLVNMPDSNSVGTDLESILTLTELDSLGLILNSFSDTLSQSISCTYVPIDKVASPEGQDSLGIILSIPDQIEYTIRFQNTGTDTVTNLVIKDVLDTNLLWTSFTPVNASHAFQTNVDQNGTVTFTFQNIMLTDSSVNALESQGFVKYSIEIKPGTPFGTSIYNSANVCFDKDDPLETNTTIHTLYDCSELDFSIPPSVCMEDTLFGIAIDSIVQSVYTWDISGVYSDTVSNFQWVADTVGTFDLTLSKFNNICPQDTTIQIIVNPQYSYDLGSISICQGDSLLVFGQNIFSAGTYYDSLQTINGCDSIYIQEIVVNPIPLTILNDTICQGDSILLFSQYISSAGTYFDTLQTVLGCDSIISSTIFVNLVFTTFDSIFVCPGDSVFLAGQYQFNVGTYLDSMQTANGCDSLVYTYLGFNVFYGVPQDLHICDGDSILIYGLYQSTQGTYFDTIQSTSGCDSIIATNLLVDPVYSVNESVSICQGDSILLGGQYQSIAGTYTDSLQSINSCDSIVHTTLNINLTYATIDYETICDGDSILIFGQYQWSPGVYIDSLQSINGCDSLLQVDLTVNSVNTIVSSNDTSVTSNAVGATYQWLDCDNGFAIISGENTSTFFPSSNGTYAVLVEQQGCLDTSDCVVISNLGVDHNILFQNVSIFPNPSTGIVNIHFGDLADVRLEIFDPRGNIFYENYMVPDDVEQLELDFPAGVYLIRLCTGPDCKVYRITIL